MPDADVTKLMDIQSLRGSLADRVYSAVKRAIMVLDFSPGAVVRKTTICDHFGISRSPVSDALTKLSGEGLVDIIPQSRTRVSRLSMETIREDTFLREALEVAATRHAARHCTPETLARLTRNTEMQKLLVGDAEIDIEEFIKTDIVFHETIMSTTQIKRLPSAVRSVSQHLDRARLLLVPEPGRSAETVDEHIEIVETIRRQDPVAAQDAMRRHVRQLLERLEPLENTRPDFFST